LQIEEQQEIHHGTEIQDYTAKYAFECYKHQKSTQNVDFSPILASVRDNILSDNNYNDVIEDINQAKENIKELESKLENVSIFANILFWILGKCHYL
jgi:plastocyanin domain-containing protein